MSLLERVKDNKGTVSSALGKKIAAEIVSGHGELLDECFPLVLHDNKNVRSTCAKIIEIVAESKTDYIATKLDSLLPVFDFPEPQTRWCILYVFGLCAKDNPEAAKKAFKLMDSYVARESGTCLLGRTIDYLGYIGADSHEYAVKSLPYLEKAASLDANLEKRVLLSYEKILESCNAPTKKMVLDILTGYTKSKKEANAKLAAKIIKKAG
jgi:hypothetical protein